PFPLRSNYWPAKVSAQYRLVPRKRRPPRGPLGIGQRPPEPLTWVRIPAGPFFAQNRAQSCNPSSVPRPRRSGALPPPAAADATFIVLQPILSKGQGGAGFNIPRPTERRETTDGSGELASD